MGRPDFEQVKNNLALVVNDSISSKGTRVTHAQRRSVDESAVMVAAPGNGMLSLADNREVSPAPVSRFAPKTLSTNIAHNRVTLPFKRAASFKDMLNSG